METSKELDRGYLNKGGRRVVGGRWWWDIWGRGHHWRRSCCWRCCLYRKKVLEL